MAAPHVAGVAAQYLEANPAATPAALADHILSTATPGLIAGTQGSPNLLLFARPAASPPPANQPPAASFTFRCTDLACTFTDGSSDGDGRVVGWSWNFGDGGTSTAQNPSRTYAAAGTYAVTLTATDDRGGTSTASKSVTVSAAANQPPAASFTFTCRDLACTFTNSSTDADGTIASSSWAFGDGSTSTAAAPSHSYQAGGTYPVKLTITDNRGASSSTTNNVTVTAPPPPVPPATVSLNASGYKVKGNQRVDLNWAGATTQTVDLYRDDVVIARPTNNQVTKSGWYTDMLNRKGGGSYRYKVCEAGSTTICSSVQTVTF
jgi:PKD repeat protein